MITVVSFSLSLPPQFIKIMAEQIEMNRREFLKKGGLFTLTSGIMFYASNGGYGAPPWMTSVSFPSPALTRYSAVSSA